MCLFAVDSIRSMLVLIDRLSTVFKGAITFYVGVLSVNKPPKSSPIILMTFSITNVFSRYVKNFSKNLYIL